MELLMCSAQRAPQSDGAHSHVQGLATTDPRVDERPPGSQKLLSTKRYGATSRKGARRLFEDLTLARRDEFPVLHRIALLERPLRELPTGFVDILGSTGTLDETPGDSNTDPPVATPLKQVSISTHRFAP